MSGLEIVKQKRSHHFITKMKGKGRSPLQVNVKDVIMGLVGGFVTILTLAFLTNRTNPVWLMAPFGASCVLAFGAWNAPLSQPRNIIGGHFISTFVGLTLYHVLGCRISHCKYETHPPAGADPLVVIMGGYSFSYLLMPVLMGSVIIVFVALIINNLRDNRQYPTFWL